MRRLGSKKAVRFPKLGHRISQSMVTQGFTVAALAKIVGIAPSKLSSARCGYSMPRPEHLTAIAQALDAPGILDIAKTYLHLTCDHCGQQFVRNPAFQRPTVNRFCSTLCRSRWWNKEVRRDRALSANGRVISARRNEEEAKDRLSEEQAANGRILASIADFCKRCEWDEVCKDAQCELREWSPFPAEGEVVDRRRLRVVASG